MAALNMTKGLIPYPRIEDDIINVAARDQSDSCRGYDHLWPDRPLIPEFIVWHKQQSPPDSTLGHPTGYFTQHCCPALTDLEVNSVTGRMRRFVERGPGHDIAGWANGRISAPYGDALKYIQWKQSQPGGWNPNLANIMGEALEISGWFPSAPVTQDTPVLEPAIANIVQHAAARAHDYGIRWDTFPLIPEENNRSYITWHQEWTIGTGKTCPGPWVMQQTPAWIDRIRAVMKAYQTDGVSVIDLPEVPRKDDPMPTGMDKAIAELLFGSVTLDGNVYAFNPRGPVSNLWLAHGKATGEWPELLSVRRFEDSPDVTRTYFVFAGGYVIWVPKEHADPRELK